MAKRTMRNLFVAGILACGLSFFANNVSAADKPGPAETSTNPAIESSAESPQTLRSYLQLQEQLHSALLAIQTTRQEAEAAGKRNAETIAVRLKLIEQALTLQREREIESMKSSENSYRSTLAIAGVLGGFGLLSLILTTLFFVRMTKRFSEIAAVFPGTPGLGLGSSVRTNGDMGLLGPNPAEFGNGRLLGALERLEKRIHELEHQALLPVNSTDLTYKNGKPLNGAENTVQTTSTATGQPEAPSEQVTLMLGKGQALLHMDRPEEALACFNEVISLDPGNAEALVKKGSVLERLKKLDEAIDCYDRAIAANNSMTLAYLYKGGVFNQLERFSEALECYELALRTQQNGAVSPSH